MNSLSASITKYDIYSIEYIIFVFLYLGLILLPFSTGKDSSFGVVSFGLPFIGMAAFLATLYLLYHKVQFAVSLKSTLLIAFVYVSLIVISAFIAPAFIPSIVRVIPHILGYMIFLFIASFVSAEKGQREPFQNRFIDALIVSGVVMGSYYLINVIYGVLTHSFIEVMLDRVLGGLMALPWGASNSVAACLLIPLIVILCDRRNEKKYGFVKTLAASIVVIAILATESRTVLSVLLAAFLLYSFLSKTIKPVLIMLAFISFILSTVYNYSSAAFDMLYNTRVDNIETLTEGRAEIWGKYINYISENPFAPVGFYGSQFVFNSSGHNIVLTTFVEMGFVGLLSILALFLNLLFMAFYSYQRSEFKDKQIKLVLSVGLLAILLNLFTEDPHFTQQYIIYFWTFSGIVSLVCSQKVVK